MSPKPQALVQACTEFSYSKTPDWQPCPGLSQCIYLPTTSHSPLTASSSETHSEGLSLPLTNRGLLSHRFPNASTTAWTFRTLSSLPCEFPTHQLHSNQVWAPAHLHFHLHDFAHAAASTQMFFLSPWMRPWNLSSNLFISPKNPPLLGPFSRPHQVPMIALTGMK